MNLPQLTIRDLFWLIPAAGIPISVPLRVRGKTHGVAPVEVG